MLRMVNTSKVSVVLAGLLLALFVLFTGGSVQAATKPNIDLQAPTGGEVFAIDQEFIIRIAPQGKVLDMDFELVVRNAAGVELGTIALDGQSNVKPFKLKLHILTRSIDSNVLFPSAHVLLRVLATTKLGVETFESGEFIVGSPGLLPNSVDTTHIIDGQVKTDDIGDGEVTSADILDLGVATGDIANNAIDGNKLASSALNDALRAVNTDHIRDGAVTSAKFGNNSVTSAKLQSDAAVDANRAVTTDHIRDSAISTAKIASQAVTPAKLQQAAVGQLLVGQGVGNSIEYKSMSGDALLSAAGVLDIEPGAVENSELATDSVTTVKILDLNVTTGKLANGAVTTGKIGTGEVQNANIATSAVDTAKIQNGTILAEDLENTFNASLHRHTDNKNVALVGNAGNTVHLTDTTNSSASGASLIGVANTLVDFKFDNADSTNLQGLLEELDGAISTALVAQNLFSSVAVPGATITANTPTTQLIFAVGAGSPLSITGVDATKTITFDIGSQSVDGNDINDSLAGDGLVMDTSPRELDVQVTAPLEISSDAVRITPNGIDFSELKTIMNKPTGSQEFRFSDTNTPLVLFTFPALDSTSDTPIFRITRSTGPAVSVFTVNSDGDITTPGFYTGANGVNVSGGFLTTGPVLTPNFSVNSANGNTTIGGTLSVTGGLSATSLSSDTDFVLDVDKNNNDGSASFTVRNNNADTIYQLSVTDASFVASTLGTSVMQGRLSISDGSSNTGQFRTVALAADRLYTLPDKDGTVAMLSDLGVPIAAPTVTSSTLRSNGTTWIENLNFTADANGNLTLGNGTTPLPGTVKLHDNFNGDNNAGTIQVASTLTGNRTYTFPDANGTVALTNSGALTLGEGTTPVQGKVVLHDNSNADNNTGTVQTASPLTGLRTYTLPDASGTFLLASGGALTLGTDTAAGGGSLVLEDDTNNNGFQGTLEVTDPLTNDRTYTLPDATGTVALTSDITATNLTGIVSAAKGGSGADNSTPADGQILVGDAGAGTYTKATLGSTNLTITTGAGALSINTPQNVASTASPTFAGLALNGDADFNGNDIVDLASITGTTGLTIATNTGGGADDLGLTGDDNVNITATTGNVNVTSTAGTLALSGSTGITSNKTITGSVAKANAVADTSTTPDVANLTLLEMDASAGTITVTDLLNGVKGQIVVVTNIDPTNTVDFADGGNFELSGARSLTPGDTFTLIFDGSLWLELAVRDNAP